MVNADVLRETASRFQRAVEDLDTSAAVDVMREDVQLFSPVLRAPFEGRGVVATVFDFLVTITSDHRFVAMTQGENEAILCFTGVLAGRDCEWIHRLQIDDDGLIWRVTDMVRPLSALLALQAAAGGRPS